MIFWTNRCAVYHNEFGLEIFIDVMTETSQSTPKKYQITVNGQQFAVASSYPEEQIREVEKFLNQKVLEMSKQLETYSLASLTVLVALNLADELLKIRRDRNYVSEEAKHSLESMCHKLDQVLGPAGT